MVKINMVNSQLIDDIWEKQVKKQIIRHQEEVKEYARKETEKNLKRELSLLVQGICEIALGIFVGYLIWG